MAAKSKPRGAMVDQACACGKQFKARKADVARGWGRSCSKPCAALAREAASAPATATSPRPTSIKDSTEECRRCGDSGVFIGVDGQCDTCAWNHSTMIGWDDHKS